ncbi:unnamed protein product [Dovyalis caffra]|uniref:Uncharacterized protein n=1 Tax=Dovyalis caffra TaxID=77055 RepID=A0AAV1SG37_9ROSI|nr:unnamed protein product [Dovyalis caffra]
MAVGIKQKQSVKKIVQKFPSRDFVLMLFHYDGIMDEWRDMEWYHRAIHRFLHPDIVSEYDYIFLWDEDLGVDNFDAGRYVSIIKEEGLDISQPALDPESSEGDRTKRIGIVDTEYIVHYGLPTLGGSASGKAQSSSDQSAARLSVSSE